MDAPLVRAYLEALPDTRPDDRSVERVRFCLSSLQSPDIRYLVAAVVGPRAADIARVISAVTRAAGAPTAILGRSLSETSVGGAAIDDELLGRAGTLAAASGYQLADTRPELGELCRRDAVVILALTAFAEASQRVAVVVDAAASATDPAHAPVPDLVVIGNVDGDEALAALALVPDGRPCVVAPLPDAARERMDVAATERGTPTLLGGRDHRILERGGRSVFLVRDEEYVTFDPLPGLDVSDLSTGLAAALALGLMGIRMREDWLLDGVAALRAEEGVPS